MKFPRKCRAEFPNCLGRTWGEHWGGPHPEVALTLPALAGTRWSRNSPQWRTASKEPGTSRLGRRRSMETGTLHTGASRWASGEGEFTIHDRAVQSMRWFWKIPPVKSVGRHLEFFARPQAYVRARRCGQTRCESSRPAAVSIARPAGKTVATVEFSPVARQENSSDDNYRIGRIAHNMP